MSVLLFENQVKRPEEFAEGLGEPSLSAQELKLAGTLVDASTEEAFDLGSYKDTHAEKLAGLIEERTAEAGRQPRREESPAVVNLMEALKASLSRKAPSKPPPKTGARKKTG
jgi:non-homologous end joining protein Ku